MEACGGRLELCIQIVRDGLDGPRLKMAIRVAKPPGVFLYQTVEGSAEVYVVQVCGENALAIVVVDLPLVEHRMANPQIKQVGIAAAGSAALDDGYVGHAVRVGKHLQHGSVDNK